MNELGEVEQIITPDGEVYDLENCAARAITLIGGRGMPGVEYESFQGYQQPYPVVVGWSLEPRTVTLQLACNAATRADYWMQRAALIQALRFNRGGPFTLRHIRADGTRRDLLCLPASTPVFPDDALGWDSYTVDIELVAFDPLFKDAVSTIQTVTFDYFDELAFPATFPVKFKQQVYSGNINLTYAGTFAAYPIIEIDGPYSSMTLTHLQTGAMLGLTVPILSGDRRIINLTPREQSLVDADDNNRFGELLMPDSNLITFNLRPKGAAWRNSPFEGVPNGINQIWIQATGVSAETRVSFVYRSQYVDLA